MSLPRADLQDIRDRISITWGYLRRHMADTEVVPEMDAIVERAAAGKSLRQLRMIAGDLQEWASGLAPEQLRELHSLLAERFGPTATLDGDATRRQRIVKRARIHTADEYRLISARVEAIYADPEGRNELEALSRLLADVAAQGRKL